MQGHDAQPIEQVGAEGARRHPLLEVPVRRGDEAHVNLDRLRSPHPGEGSVFEHPQELRLQGGLVSAISSRNSVPPFARSNTPRWRLVAPLNEPRS